MQSEELVYKKELLRTHERRCRELELKEAAFGLNCPPEIKTEIKDIRDTISNLKREVDLLIYRLDKSSENKQKTVLLIDDETIILENMAMLLTEEGFRVITAESGIDGIRLATEERPDLVLLDIMMPGVNGYAVLTEIVERRIPTRVIIFTGHSVSANILMKSGACDVLYKGSGGDLIDSIRFSLEMDSTIDVILENPLKIINPLLIRLDDSYNDQIEMKSELRVMRETLTELLKTLQQFQFDENIKGASKDIRNTLNRMSKLNLSLTIDN